MHCCHPSGQCIRPHSGAIQVLRHADEGGGHIFWKKRYNVISGTRGGLGQISWEKALRNTWMAPQLYGVI